MRSQKKTTRLLKRLSFLGGLIGVITLSSCTDWLTIYPTDKTVSNDFWKNKKDVEGMMNGAYVKMINHSCVERAIMWGAYRSDELVKNSNYSNTDLDNIAAVNLLPTSGYTNWSAFYSVINTCNIVLEHAEGVMALDPEYTEGDYKLTRGQMLALRSLCYFYLVRTFRDVPYITHSFEDDDQTMTIAQSTPDSVLNNCIRDLEEAGGYVMKSGAYGNSDWRNHGYITRDAVNAILCDIYLWRASMTHNAADYQKVVEYADKVIQAKDAYYQANYSNSMTTGQSDIYHLLPGETAFTQLFYTGNSRESILELQFDGTNNSNTAVENYYSAYDQNHMGTSMLKASQIFNKTDENANTTQGSKVYLSKHDYRYWNNAFDVENEEASQVGVRKYISTMNLSTSSTKGEPSTQLSSYSNFKRNWIVYRLTDIMLMKAEAETQLAGNAEDDAHLKTAFNLVQAVYKRSLDAEARADTLKPDAYKDKASMELLVLAERERELCFEGKRWFDLMRYAYRHMDGVRIDARIADQNEWPSLPSQVLKFIVRKYTSGGDAVSYKMKTEPYLYWPLRRGEIKVNALLKQNPVYIEEETTSKN